MFGTEFLDGQGLGNQLFCYVSARAIAEKSGYRFACAGKENFGYNIHNSKGLYFMDVDLGEDLDKNTSAKYHEFEKRIITCKSWHDAHIGCDIRGIDTKLFELDDNTVIYGILQAEDYFIEYKEQIKDWLRVKEQYENYELSSDDICILNMRGGEYLGDKALYLKKKYWIDAMKVMKGINPSMKFVIITEDVEAAKRMFPDIQVQHSDIAGDYVAIKNAHYLIVSNSSFAFFPVFTSDNLKYLVAPKYWARHNVSDGYWSCEQNIYSGWNYLDRNGKLFSAEECKKEFNQYRNRSSGRQSIFWKKYCRIKTDIIRMNEKVIRFITLKLDGLRRRIGKVIG